ncbi:MAG: SUMF1/EgtB/PvdO family nonheme iron enzyme [Caldilineaceae bacterium]|nr:SUMF1/EgtB/PvdO family nonheme iron enzyme [Caldilineaceae bacterium]
MSEHQDDPQARIEALERELAELRAQATARARNVSTRDLDRSVIVSGDNNSVAHIVKIFRRDDADLDEARLREQIADYLIWVRDRLGAIEMRGIRREGQQVVQLELETVYVPLAATRPGGAHADIALSDVLNQGERLIVTGGPGSGKSTVMQHVAWTLATAIATDDPQLAVDKLGLDLTPERKGDPEKPVPLPIFVPLSAYVERRRQDANDRTLAAFISRYLTDRQSGLDLPANFFAQLLRTGQSVILLLDGLDEVPNEAERVAVRQAIEDLVTGRDRMRMIMTCRTAAYQGRTALGRGFRELRVLPLTQEHIAALVRHAYAAIYPHDPAQATRKAEELIDGVAAMERERQQRLDDATVRIIDSPLLVRMLLVVHLSERRMPQHRAELYQRATETMLWPEYLLDENVAERVGRFVGKSHETHREMVQHLAFAMQSRGESQGRELSEDEVRAILAEQPAFVPHIDDFIAVTRLRGTLMEERMGVYRFIHLAFQEYLAARYLAEVERSVDAIVDVLKQGPVLDSWWRETILLVAGYLSLTSPPTARTYVERLSRSDSDACPLARQTPDVQLQAAALALVACGEWMRDDEPLFDALNARVVDLLADGDATSVKVRIEACRTLSQLGDPRPGVGVVDGLPDIVWLPVPAGPFTMGDGSDSHTVNVPAFCISKYPITNVQYAAFVSATGRSVPEHWTDGLPPRDQRNHPVINVSWDDAQAFFRWLSEQMEQSICLPSEAEWEKAARGDKDKRTYPWGDDEPDAVRCNFDGNVGSTTSMGIYPAGASPYGCLDMSGNVWEWTQSEYRSYPYDPDDGREADAAHGDRVVRGGSFDNSQIAVRCAFRDWGDLEDRLNDFGGIGFRVVGPPCLCRAEETTANSEGNEFEAGDAA